MDSSPAFQFDFEAAQALSPHVRFGTSSWNYPGWAGLVYHAEYKNEKDLRARSLLEYGRFPWFRTVGIDSAFYSPLSEKTLLSYAKMVPTDFQWVSKVFEEITIPLYAKYKRYGEKAGKPNPNFLNAAIFQDQVLAPYNNKELAPHCGPFVFQFQAFGSDLTAPPERFLSKLERFFELLPAGFHYAVEIRNRELLVPDYFRLLNRFQVTHCFNHWTSMPPLVEQMSRAAESGGLSAPFYVARVLTPLGVSYEQAVARFQPYDSIKQPNNQMRQDIQRLGRRAIEKKATAFIIVNNRAEGCAPITIDTIGKALVKQQTI